MNKRNFEHQHERKSMIDKSGKTRVYCKICGYQLKREKLCRTCLEIKDYRFFRKTKRSSDWHLHHCNKCEREILKPLRKRPSLDHFFNKLLKWHDKSI